MNIARRSLLSAVAMAAAPTRVLGAANLRNLQSEIDKAKGGIVQLPAGTFSTTGVHISRPMVLQGVAGQTKLICSNGEPTLSITDTSDVSLIGIDFIGQNALFTDKALVVAKNVVNLTIEKCSLSDTKGSGLDLFACSGRIIGNHFSNIGDTALVSLDGIGLEISSNDMTNMGNNGIQIWRSAPGEDGTQILHNRISHVRFEKGGDGEYGNAIIVYRAGNVIAAHNRVSDLAYTGIRFNSSNNGQIIGNNISRTGEKAIYSEFSFEGMVIANNVVEDTAFGISITNFDVGGRLAVCSGNLVRNVRRGKTVSADVAWGISADADTVVSNNVVENVDDAAINLGWSGMCRNLVAQGNIVRNCDRGIAFSTTVGSGKVMITGNMIDGARIAAIQGMDYFNPSTDDLAVAGNKVPAQVMVSNNMAFKS